MELEQGLHMMCGPAPKNLDLRIPRVTHTICRNGGAHNSSSMSGSDLDALPGSCGAQSRGAIPAVEFSRRVVPSNPL